MCARPLCLPAGLPHARGGVSAHGLVVIDTAQSSPRSWGCFQGTGGEFRQSLVFPTLVGVFPYLHEVEDLRSSLPHARGGVSARQRYLTPEEASSPRSWGCFRTRRKARPKDYVFSTLVGVFPRQSPAWGTIRSKWELLHVLCPYSKEINANGTLLKRRKKASYRANFLLIVPMLYRFKKYF